MHLAKLRIENFRCFGTEEHALDLTLRQGLTALVGENDAGKSAVIDAIRLALGTTDQEWFRLDDDDFHKDASEILIQCTFDGLDPSDLHAFVEYLSYGLNDGDPPQLVLTWTAKNTGQLRHGRPYRSVAVRSGRDGSGPEFAREARDLLRATYLRPLRDAEQALAAGRGSRLAQVLIRASEVFNGDHEPNLEQKLDPAKLSMLGISKLLEQLLREQPGVAKKTNDINALLASLSFHNQPRTSAIDVRGSQASENARVRELLERLSLLLKTDGRSGLGSNNILFMCCELLLLEGVEEGLRLLLIEEPEAHLHAQAQLKVLQYIQTQAAHNGIQVIVTTHSPHLASAIRLDNLVMIQNRRAYPLARGETKLAEDDYEFLERFLDATKANLFFARGVMMVEGDAENLLLPVLARLLGRDLTTYGVSIVNVGHLGMFRYFRILQRQKDDEQLAIPVACVTDLDLVPPCANEIIPKFVKDMRKTNENEEDVKKRRSSRRRHDAQNVKTFVSNSWTLEFVLAHFGLGEQVLGAVNKALGRDDESGGDEADLSADRYDWRKVCEQADTHKGRGWDEAEVRAAYIYRLFESNPKPSKAAVAQYLGQILEKEYGANGKSDELRKLLPSYLTDAVAFVTEPFNGADDASASQQAD